MKRLAARSGCAGAVVCCIKLVVVFMLLCSCERGGARGRSDMQTGDAESQNVLSGVPEAVSAYDAKLGEALRAAEIPDVMSERIIAAGESVFLPDLLAATKGDLFLRRLVDKRRALPEGYEPDDLVLLDNGGSYRVGRAGLRLRREAAESLERMAQAARAEGVTLVVSSSYRSFDYQTEVYQRNVRESGQETADRESSRPGFSQHQLGLVVDFGSITDAFAQTAAGRWMLANGPAYGWSLSFPDGYEDITGYRWESWHYRYTGVALADFIDRWFDGIQQYAMQFIYAWEGY
ncbi:MAG: M15 family metallopeptidase [Spirochaetaceae bacterium]|jgi:D-alanyl-D-alanine carboxypeptidase|nr:M15 family metallopeptidase [Spirochaetaceae bacterium]